MPKTFEYYQSLLAEHGSVSAAARALQIPRSTLQNHILRSQTGRKVESQAEPRQADTKPPDSAMSLLAPLKTKRTLAELSNLVDRGTLTVKGWIAQLQSEGYAITKEGDYYFLQRDIARAEANVKAHVNGLSTRIGILSDTHLGSKCQQLTHLREFYRICEDSQVEDIFHVGDLVTGLRHRHDIFLHELQDQIDYAVEHYPRRPDGKKTKIISGNHDLWAIRDGGVDPVRAFAKERNDVEFLGEYSANVFLKPDVKLYLLHPDGGSAYADSYRLQKLIESFDGGEKPHIVVMGHFHRALYMNSRNIDGLLAGCFESQTDFLRRKAIQPRVGAWIIDIDFNDDNSLRRFRPEFVSWPQVLKKDYK